MWLFNSSRTSTTLLMTGILIISMALGADNMTAGTDAPAHDIPALLDRSPGLNNVEFQRVQQRYAELKTRLINNNDDVDAIIETARIFMSEARITGEHPYYYPAALRLLNGALEIAPMKYEALVSLGSVQMSLHKFREAMATARRAIDTAPERATAYGILCDASLELGDYTAAVQACDRMVRLRPDLRSYARISYLREIHGDMSGAIEAMQMAVNAGIPGSEERAWVQTTLGNLYLKTGNATAAQQAFYRAALERDQYPFALAGLARVQAMLGNTAQAFELLETAANMAPEFSFLQLKADLLRAAGENTEADALLAEIESMLAEDEAAGHVMDREFALMYADHDIKLDQAAARAAKELAKRPDNIDAQHTAAIVALHTGRAAEAQALIRRAMRLGSADPVMLAHAGLIEAALGNREQARKLLESAVSANPFLPVLLKQEVFSTLNALS